MTRDGMYVRYTGDIKGSPYKSHFWGKVVSDPYEIRDCTYVNVVWANGYDSDWHVVNVEHLEEIK